MSARPPRPVHTPMILQMEAAECGAASLGIVLAWHGRWVPMSALRTACGVSRHGSNAASILTVARTYGMTATGYKKSVATLRELKPPFIVFWEFNHFLVVDGFDGDTVRLNDPAFGHRAVTLDEFDRGFTGVTLVLEPGPTFTPGGAPPSVTASLLHRLRPYADAEAVVLITALLLVLPTMATAVFLQVFVDEVIGRGQRAMLAPMIALLLLTTAVQVGLGALQQRALRRIQLALAADGSRSFLAHLLRLPISFHGQRSLGELSERVTLNDELAENAGGHLALAAVDSVMVGLFALVMVWYDPRLTLFACLGAATGVIAVVAVSEARAEAQARHQQAQGREIAVAVEGLRDLETIKASGLEDDLYARWASGFGAAMSSGQALASTSNRLSLWMPTFASVTAAVVLWVGGQRVMDGSLTLGTLVGFQAIVTAFYGPLNRLLARSADLQSLRADVTRIDDVMHEVIPVATAEAPTPRRVEGALAVRSIAFGFGGPDGDLLRGVSAEVLPGGWLGVLGPSGSGKSTLLRVLAGLYSPRSGDVLLDGSPLLAWPLDRRTACVAFVDQDVALFAGTVRENLTLWRPGLPDARLAQACADAEVLDVVRALPGGFDAVLPEGGVNLSGGERQRLELARALANDPVVLLLDEATSALDAETERRVIRNLRARGVTVVLVAHRLSTVRDCDELIVLDAGQVVERGTHASLQAQASVYARLLADADGVGP
jgi:ATP-binding cassette subfamily C protein